MAKNTSEHILGTAANLLGICLFVITSLHVTDRSESSRIDEFTSVIALLLILSTLFSYVSIRSVHPTRAQQMEKVADYFFIISLTGIAVIILLMVFRFIQ